MTFLIVNVSKQEAEYLNYAIYSFGGKVVLNNNVPFDLCLIGEENIEESLFDCECLMTSYILFCEAFYCKLNYERFKYKHLAEIKKARNSNDISFLEKYTFVNMFNSYKQTIESFYISN
jgi:hypothetical protein